MSSAMRSKRILIVDDEKDTTDTFKIALEQQQEGFEVITYNDPDLALSQFKENWFDLILLDIRMPKMTGFELYRRLNEIDSKPKVCFITAFDIYYDEFKKVFPSLEVKCFLRKPISTPDLVEQVKLQFRTT
jgi:two-component system, OmpR family, response regulator ChvI